jgi:hypothetical protein
MGLNAKSTKSVIHDYYLKTVMISNIIGAYKLFVM